jgi:hypothetical protein
MLPLKRNKKNKLWTLWHKPVQQVTWQNCDVHCFVHRRGSHNNHRAIGECNSSADTVWVRHFVRHDNYLHSPYQLITQAVVFLNSSTQMLGYSHKIDHNHFFYLPCQFLIQTGFPVSPCKCTDRILKRQWPFPTVIMLCVLHVHRAMLLAAANQALATILEKLGLR